MVMRAPANTPGQQDAPFPLVMKHQGQQGHHQDKDDGAADDAVGDAGIIAQTVVQCHKARSFCVEEKGDEEKIGDGRACWLIKNREDEGLGSNDLDTEAEETGR